MVATPEKRENEGANLKAPVEIHIAGLSEEARTTVLERMPKNGLCIVDSSGALTVAGRPVCPNGAPTVAPATVAKKEDCDPKAGPDSARQCRNDLRIRLTNPTVADVSAVMDSLVEAGLMQNPPLEFVSGVFEIRSVAASSTSVVQLQGDVTAGATVALDLGDRIARPPVSPTGHWSVPIPPSEALEEDQGWVSGYVEAQGARQYFRTNLLSGKHKDIAFDELPEDSQLREEQEERASITPATPQ